MEFLASREGRDLYLLVKAFDFKILPAQFLQMSRNEINTLIAMKLQSNREAQHHGRRTRS